MNSRRRSSSSSSALICFARVSFIVFHLRRKERIRAVALSTTHMVTRYAFWPKISKKVRKFFFKHFFCLFDAVSEGFSADTEFFGNLVIGFAFEAGFTDA